MRKKEDTFTIRVNKAVYDRIKKDKAHFQKLIGGGKWSINDTLREWIKILDGIEDGS